MKNTNKMKTTKELLAILGYETNPYLKLSLLQQRQKLNIEVEFEKTKIKRASKAKAIFDAEKESGLCQGCFNSPCSCI